MDALVKDFIVTVIVSVILAITFSISFIFSNSDLFCFVIFIIYPLWCVVFYTYRRRYNVSVN